LSEKSTIAESVKRPPCVIGFYTKEYPYVDMAHQLMSDCDKLGLLYKIQEVHSRGSWHKNIHIKPHFIMECLCTIKGPILYLDVDARIHLFPDLLCTMTDVDLAYHRLESSELLSGTLYFGGGPGSIFVVQEWIRQCERRPDLWEQKSLDYISKKLSGVNIQELPPSYCCIFDHKMRQKAGPIVIEQMQASRQAKKIGQYNEV